MSPRAEIPTTDFAEDGRVSFPPRGAEVAVGVLACRRAVASRPAEKISRITRQLHTVPARRLFHRFFRAAGRAPSTAGGTPTATALAGCLPMLLPLEAVGCMK